MKARRGRKKDDYGKCTRNYSKNERMRGHGGRGKSSGGGRGGGRSTEEAKEESNPAESHGGIHVDAASKGRGDGLMHDEVQHEATHPDGTCGSAAMYQDDDDDGGNDEIDDFCAGIGITRDTLMELAYQHEKEEVWASFPPECVVANDVLLQY